ncbi:MAG: class I SAM-dependent methyltransferase [Candidatus Omnitrophica bacterium]|nr:class I SAM-dependent methyltransferase [Candidatus Omnitrophota bacterium]
MKKDFVKEYWQSQAEKYHTSPEASWADQYMIELELLTIGPYLQNQDQVLDVGCANGHATLELFSRHNIKTMFGVDFSEKMIEQANCLKIQKNLTSVRFQTADSRNLPFDTNCFDVVFSVRMLINLPNWEEQTLAIEECLRVTKPGGKLILSEAFQEPLQTLNALRAVKELEPMKEQSFNRYMKMKNLNKLLENKGLSFQIEDFSSIYYLGSRFLRELLDIKGFVNPLNKVFFDLENKMSGGGFGIQQAYIIKKH